MRTVSIFAARRVLLRSTVAALALAGAHPAVAADATTTASADASANASADAEIIVTARHREESSQSIPIAVSVVGEKSLERTGNFTLNQVQQLVPSLQVSSFNPRNTNINIRGLGANSSLAVDGLEYGVGFYLDGVYYGRPAQSQFDLVDLQQIEVLHGPQGTLWGKNTTAGAINVTSKLPSFTPELAAEGSVGNYNYRQIRVSGSAPLSDKVAFRLSVADTQRDGFLTNIYDGSSSQNYDNISIRGQLLIKPSDAVKIRLISDFSRQNQHFQLSLVDGTFTTFANGATIPNNIIQRAARTGYTLPGYDAFARIGNSNSLFQANMETWGFSGQVDYDAGPVTLTSITSARWWDWWPANDADATSLSINLAAQQQNFQRQFSQELRVASNGKHLIDYQGGLYFFSQVVRGYGRTQYGSDFAIWNVNPAAPTTTPTTVPNTALALTNFEADSYSDPRVKSYAAFGQADVHLADPLTLTVGLRYTHEDKTGSFSRWQLANSGLDLSALTPAQLTTVQTIRNAAANQLFALSFIAADTSDAVTGLATLSYKVSPDVLVYGTYSKGNKSGGLNITGGGVLNPVVRPEKVNNYEIGVKSQLFNRAVTLNLAAFRTDVTDYQANVSVPSVHRQYPQGALARHRDRLHLCAQPLGQPVGLLCLYRRQICQLRQRSQCARKQPQRGSLAGYVGRGAAGGLEICLYAGCRSVPAGGRQRRGLFPHRLSQPLVVQFNRDQLQLWRDPGLWRGQCQAGGQVCQWQIRPVHLGA